MSIRRLTAGVVVFAVLAAGCTSNGSSHATPTSSASAPAPQSSAAPAISTGGAAPAAAQSSAAPAAPTGSAGSVATLAAAGVATVADESASTPATAVTGATVLTVTQWQAANMAAEATSRGGISGADLNTMLPMPANSPQIDDILGGWVLTAPDPTAVAAGQLLGAVSWTQPEQVIFPTEVLTLFVADALQHAQVPGPAATTSGSAWRGSGVHVQDASLTTNPCSTVSNFVAGVLDKVFGILKIDADALGAYVSAKVGGGLFGSIVGGLFSFGASLWNKAVELAEQTVKDALTSLTQPVVNVLALVIGGVAVISAIRGILKHWSAPITAKPDRNAFSVGTTAGNPGSFVVAIDTDAEQEDWPEQLKDCATAAGVPLPTLATPGSPVTWTVTPEEPGLVTPGELTGVVDKALTETLDYRTGSEDAKLAKTGVLVSPTVTVSVRVRRTEVEQLRQFITSYITGKVPGLLAPILNPILTSYIEYATKWLDLITAIRGSSTIVVTHHKPKPTPTPPPCTAAGKTIPAGTYAGTFTATITVVLHTKGQIQAIGSGTSHGTGRVAITSDGRTVTGTMTFSGTGSSQLNLSGAAVGEDTFDGDLKATISGPADNPVVSGTTGGNSSVAGAVSSPFNAGLHVTRADCTSVSGDVVPMLQDEYNHFTSDVTIGGSGGWTAARTR